MSTKISVRMLLLVIILISAFSLTSTSRADNGPHGGSVPGPDSCATCHRIHTGQDEYLVFSSVIALCASCHGSSATGADTDVWDGLYLERDAEAETPTEGFEGNGLKGGGFANALMDSDLDGTATSAPSTSAHTFDGSVSKMWGNGENGSGSGVILALNCTNCHNPHGRAGTGGTATYRILNPIPTGSGAAVAVDVPEESLKNYTITDPNYNYMQEGYGLLAVPLTNWCSQCHTRYLAPGGSGHTDSGDSFFAFRHSTLNVGCMTCHVAHGSSGQMGQISGAVLWPDLSAAPNSDSRSSLLRLENRGVCAYCHVTTEGGIGGGCELCHGVPPTSGAHQQHAGPDNVGYGLTGSYAADTGYQYGCGECHPASPGQHQNGTVEVVLISTGAPEGSLKAKNSQNATYSSGSCGGVYCHSGLQVNSGPVGLPLTDEGGSPILDPYGNLTYDPYPITFSRNYQTTPPWQNGTIDTCTACHAFPLATSSPDVQAGVGDTHQWIDDNGGYGNLHAFNMSFDPIACRTCHYGEIIELGTWSRNANDITTYDPVPIASYDLHANGQADVNFDTVNDVVYPAGGGTRIYSLASATYNPTEKSCSNVGCHIFQSYVRWGTPYRSWISAECDLCHRINLPLTGQMISNSALSENTVSHKYLNTTNCRICHPQAHGRE